MGAIPRREREQENRYIGRYGAIGCFSSLPLIVEQAKAQNINDFRIAIDESDFSYALKALQPVTAIGKLYRRFLKRQNRKGWLSRVKPNRSWHLNL